MTLPQPPPSPVLDPRVVQVLLSALMAEPVAVTIPRIIPPPEHLHLGPTLAAIMKSPLEGKV